MSSIPEWRNSTVIGPYSADAIRALKRRGPRPFPEDADPRKLSLFASESYDNGVVYMAHRPQA